MLTPPSSPPTVQAGDIQLLHNWTNLHTRSEYEDYEVWRCGGGWGGATMTSETPVLLLSLPGNKLEHAQRRHLCVAIA